MDCPEGETPVEWIFVTTESVTDAHSAIAHQVVLGYGSYVFGVWGRQLEKYTSPMLSKIQDVK